MTINSCNLLTITTFLAATTILTGCGETADMPNGAVQATDAEAAEIVYFDQNWDAEMRADYYYTTQGSRLIPQAWFGALEQADNEGLFADRDNLARFGLLYAESQPEARHLPAGQQQLDFHLPIGFAIDPTNLPDTDHWLGLTCAACHTNNVVVNGITMRVDGAPSMFDFGSFMTALSAAVAAGQPYPDDQTGQTVSPKFRAFAARLQGANPTEEQLRELAVQYGEFADRFIAQTSMRVAPVPAGPGRVDALTQIVNALAVFDLGIEANHQQPFAPTSFPFLWLTPRLDWVQWNPIASNPIARNGGEVLGVFGTLELGDDVEQPFSSSIQFENLFNLEQWIKTLDPPRWREDIMGEIKIKDAIAGAKLFKADCLGCHNMQVPDEDGKLSYRLTDADDNEFGKQFIEITQVPIDKIQTDPVYVAALLRRTVETGSLADALFDKRATVPAVEFFSTVVGAAVRKGLADLQLDPETQLRYIDFRSGQPSRFDTLKGGPLDGIWATGPFLHNGSVPNVDELLQTPEDRSETFWVGSLELDTEKLGFVSTEKGGGVEFKTLLRGNGNAGHSYPKTAPYTEEERAQVIEYLKDPRRFAEYLVDGS